jgi:hypothetical protein
LGFNRDRAARSAHDPLHGDKDALKVTWQGALLARLRAAAGVTALISTRSYWQQAPQSVVRPYVTLLDVTAFRPQILNGWDLEPSRVQIDAWSSEYLTSTTIMDAVLAALVPGGTSNGHTFQRADVALGPRDIAGERDGTTPIFRKSADLIIHHTA